jgi:diketogulonate reductase-like aldo/keto reductase
VLRTLIVGQDREPTRYTRVRDVRVPTLIYGTAWKEDDTTRLARMALDAGFRGIDTANQRRHYHEAGVGEALAGALAAGRLRREDVFLQTKFTYVGGHDHRLPYDPRAPLATQVDQSFASSLQHLGVDYLDSYVLHGPSVGHGLSADDWETWEAMERLRAAGKTRLLGVSNVNVGQLAELYAGASTKPAIVQNRCFAAMGWDRAVRQFCRERDILYQGFSLLTANRDVLRHRRVHEIAARTGRTVPQVIFRFALQVGMTALTGTTSGAHMAEDLSVYDFELEPDEVRALDELVA